MLGRLDSETVRPEYGPVGDPALGLGLGLAQSGVPRADWVELFSGLRPEKQRGSAMALFAIWSNVSRGFAKSVYASAIRDFSVRR